MTADRVLARTTAVLSRIDDALDDPFPAAVARLAGVQGSWFPCHSDDHVTIGAAHGNPWLWDHDPGHDDDACSEGMSDEGDYWPDGCWADDTSWGGSCAMGESIDLGLCAKHHAEIVGADPTLEVTIGGVPVPCKAFEVEMAPITDVPDGTVAVARWHEITVRWHE